MKLNIAIAGALVAFGLGLTSRPAHAQFYSTNQSVSSCTSQLCIDAPPQGPGGLDGSGGWGWDSKKNQPVQALIMGKSAQFTVTVLQPWDTPLCGSGNLTITLNYSSRDFNLNATDSTGNTGADPFQRGGVETFTYSGDFLCHVDQSVAFTFTPQHSTATAPVTATINVGGQQASETFNVAIDKK
jgi:hypothetical protein